MRMMTMLMMMEEAEILNPTNYLLMIPFLGQEMSNLHSMTAISIPLILSQEVEKNERME